MTTNKRCRCCCKCTSSNDYLPTVTPFVGVLYVSRNHPARTRIRHQTDRGSIFVSRTGLVFDAYGRCLFIPPTHPDVRDYLTRDFDLIARA